LFKETEEQDLELIGLAIEMFKKALTIQENFVSSRFHLGQMYHRTH